MANSPATPPHNGSAGAFAFGRVRVTLLLVLLVLLVACIFFSWTTRGAMSTLPFLNRKGVPAKTGTEQTLVDLRPWQTAQALAPMAVSAEEKEYASEAERLADHEVDQAFAVALRNAGLAAQHLTLTGDALALSQKVAQLKQLKQQDQALIDSLHAKGSTADRSADHGAGSGSTSDDLEVAKAQLGLDSDELADAQQDLARASGDNSVRIQNELAAHEAAMRQYDSEVKSGGQIAVLSVSQNGTLARRIKAWFNQQDRSGLIRQALQESQDEVSKLTAEHNTLESTANAAAAAAASTGAASDRATRLANLNDRSVERQILSIDDDRIQTEQQLATVYSKWLAQVGLQHSIVLHLILQSLMVILFILIGMLACDSLVRRLMAHPALDRRQMRTLRSVLEMSIQVVGVLLILLVVFGSPQQTPTILGLTTAALTIALQDYIVAFLGWFVLMGKNGIHVGDWVEINHVGGEVTEIGLMTTTLLETGAEAGEGHPTGRRISFMNSFAIRGQYFNFSTAGQWMWDEIAVSLPSSTDIHAAMEKIHRAVSEETEKSWRAAEQEWKHATREEGLGRFSAAPVVNLRPTGSGIDLQIRYVTAAAERFAVRNRIYQRMVELLHAQQDTPPENVLMAQKDSI